jgi:hypothetical protein
MKERRVFLKTHKEFELLSEYTVQPLLLDEYIRNDGERANAPPNLYPCIYDCIEMSPFYDPDDFNDQYYDDKDLIELPEP